MILNTDGGGVEPVLADYRQLLENIKRESPETLIYVESILPTESQISGIDDRNILKINAGLKQISSEFQITYIDLYSHFIKDEKMNGTYTYDGVHLNSDGYQLLGNIIEEYVR